jgi:hypothetical protein
VKLFWIDQQITSTPDLSVPTAADSFVEFVRQSLGGEVSLKLKQELFYTVSDQFQEVKEQPGVQISPKVGLSFSRGVVDQSTFYSREVNKAEFGSLSHKFTNAFQR